MSNYAGVDWAADKHDVRVSDQTGEELLAATFAHDEKGLRALCRALVRLKVELVAIERPDGLLVERLLDAGLRVLPMHPNQVAAARARFRAAGGKSDRFDAFVLCELARTDREGGACQARSDASCSNLVSGATFLGLLIHAAVGSSGGTVACGRTVRACGRRRRRARALGRRAAAGAWPWEGGWGHQPDPGVPVLLVVPAEELPGVSAGVLDVVEPVGELGPVLQGLEVRLRVGVVAGGERAGCVSW